MIFKNWKRLPVSIFSVKFAALGKEETENFRSLKNLKSNDNINLISEK